MKATAELRRTYRCRLVQLFGYAAVAALTLISCFGNLRFGVSLAAGPTDQVALATASAAIDILKALLPLLAVNLWRRSCRGWAAVSAVFWIACLSWSACSAIGFAVQARSQINAERMTEQAAMHGSTAAIGRAERQLKAIGTARPVAVVKADLAATRVAAPIWARTQGCSDVTVPESFAACAEVLSLRRELAAAEIAERLEKSIAAERQGLRTIKAAPAELDPQAAALSRLLGLKEPFVRMGLALLLAAVVEAGSALGFTLIALATGTGHVAPAPRLKAASPQKSFRPLATRSLVQPRAKSAFRTTNQSISTESSSGKVINLQNQVRSFLLARTTRAEGSALGASELYGAFRLHCLRQGLPESSQQLVGRQLTGLGLKKGRCSRTGRIAYIGVALVHETDDVTKALDTGLKPQHDMKVQQGRVPFGDGLTGNIQSGALQRQTEAIGTT